MTFSYGPPVTEWCEELFPEEKDDMAPQAGDPKELASDTSDGDAPSAPSSPGWTRDVAMAVVTAGNPPPSVAASGPKEREIGKTRKRSREERDETDRDPWWLKRKCLGSRAMPVC